MVRTLCVWFPDWPLRRPDAPPDRACLVVDGSATPRVVAFNQYAGEAGVRLGMRRPEAEVLCPGGTTLEQDYATESLVFESVAGAVEELVPRVEVADPGLLFVPIDGAIRYYGGEPALIDNLARAVREAAGAGGRIGVAGGPFAARWAAASAGAEPYIVDDDRQFLASLDIDVLGKEELVATFRWLGIGTLGALASLPRPAVLSRFGQAGLHAHRLASGEDRRPEPRAIPDDPSVTEHFEEPLVLLEQVGFAARALSHRLMEAMGESGIAPHRVEVSARAADGTARTRVWRSADSFTEKALAERVWWQLRAWNESAGIPGGIVQLRLAPADLSGEGRQLTLLEDVAARIEAERAVARVQALLGPDAVLEGRSQGGRDPIEQVRWHRWGDDPPAVERDPRAPWPGSTPGPSPALVPPEPQLLEVEWDGGMPSRVRLRSRWEPVLNWAGPWRKLGRWWRGEPHVDRYQIVTSAGALLCELRHGQTFVIGVYD
ncbi:MAG TPA: DNA polymerase Y family protein [Acidimicrobiia bacterium]|nr:DNA polymerase Y family protein [Acidimicrobiia bacterium]